MSATGSGYDLSTSTYSPDGRVFQLEYAQKAVESDTAGSAFGIRCIDGVVLGVKKTVVSKMLVPGSNRCIHSIDEHSGIAFSGLAADARNLANKARTEAVNYRSFYGHPIPGKILSDRLAAQVHMHTLYFYLRPFGCAALVGTNDADGPALYSIDPTGVSNRFFACSIGKNKEGARSELEKINFKEITCRRAVNLIASIVYKLHDDVKDKKFELELSWICDESNKMHVRVPADVSAAAEAAAIEEKRRADFSQQEEAKVAGP